MGLADLTQVHPRGIGLNIRRLQPVGVRWALLHRLSDRPFVVRIAVHVHNAAFLQFGVFFLRPGFCLIHIRQIVVHDWPDCASKLIWFLSANEPI